MAQNMYSASQETQGRSALLAGGFNEMQSGSLWDFVLGLKLPWVKAWALIQAFIAAAADGKFTGDEVIALGQLLWSLFTQTTPPAPDGGVVVD